MTILMGVINPFITIGSGPTEWYATLIDEKKTPLLKASTESSPHDEEVMEVRQSLFVFFFGGGNGNFWGSCFVFFWEGGLGWGRQNHCARRSCVRISSWAKR